MATLGCHGISNVQPISHGGLVLHSAALMKQQSLNAFFASSTAAKAGRKASEGSGDAAAKENAKRQVGRVMQARACTPMHAPNALATRPWAHAATLLRARARRHHPLRKRGTSRA